MAFSPGKEDIQRSNANCSAIDRLVNHSVILELNIGSYWIEAAEKKKRTETDGLAKAPK
jgi:hypothetical protein